MVKIHFNRQADRISSGILKKYKEAERLELDKLINRLTTSGEYCFALNFDSWESDSYEEDISSESAFKQWTDYIKESAVKVYLQHPKTGDGFTAYVLSACNDLEDNKIFIELLDTEMQIVGDKCWWPSDLLFAGKLQTLSTKIRLEHSSYYTKDKS